MKRFPGYGKYSSPRWSSRILYCYTPMTFDQYDHCSYDCLYCFSFNQKILKMYNPLFPNETKPYYQLPIRSVNVDRFKKLFLHERKSQFEDYIKMKIPMQWGGLADPFCNFEKRHGIGLELMQFIHEIDYPITFSTKGTWWVYDERYRELFAKQKNWSVKYSIINLDKDFAKKTERGCPSPEERIKAIKELNTFSGSGVVLSLKPFVIGASDKNEEYLDLLEQCCDAGINSVVIEFYCLENRSGKESQERYNKMSDALGFDVQDFYRKNSPGQSSYFRLNHSIKRPYIDKIEKVCRKRGIRLHMCDAHHKDKCDEGACCGISRDIPVLRGQIAEAVWIARTREDKQVRWKRDMEPHLDMFKKFLWRGAEGFNTSGTRTRCSRWNQTMYDYMHEVWNTPNAEKSPYKSLYGLLHPVGLDEDNDVIYEYRPYEGGETSG